MVGVQHRIVVWNRAQAASVVLPKADDPAYVSLETLLRYVLGAARGYMTWMEPTALPAEAGSYMEHRIRHAFQLEELMRQR